MGCDIHAAVEYKEFGMWFPRGIPYRNRDYLFFTALAGVRDVCRGDDLKIVPLAPFRGLPPNIDELSKECLGCGDHSDSWCTLKELKEYDQSQIITWAKTQHWYEPKYENGLTKSFRYWIELGELIARQEQVDEDCVRFVFNFDN